MAMEDFWQDAEQAACVSKQVAAWQDEVHHWEHFLQEIDDLLTLTVLADEEGDHSMEEGLKQRYTELEEEFFKREFATLFSGSHDQSNAIVSIHAGSGGTEAQDWAEMLLRMFLRFCETKGWQAHILWDSRGSEAGIKSATFRVVGRYAYGYLQSEAGVHRLVRISPFDASKSRHTSFALVEVLPELEELSDIAIDPNDLRIDTFRSGGAGGQNVNKTSSAVRIVHIPTNITVVCQNERSQIQNKETAMKILAARLEQISQKQREEEKQELRGEFKSAAWGNQIRSYVLHPYQMVKDHRTEYETSSTQAVLDGLLEPFMESYLRLKSDRSGHLEKANKELHEK